MSTQWNESLDEILDETKDLLNEVEHEDGAQKPPQAEAHAAGAQTPRTEAYAAGPQTPRTEERAAKPQKKKKRRKGRIVLLVLLALLAAFAVWFLTAGQPKRGEMRLGDDAFAERRLGCCSVLLAGTDKGGMRTDTMLLLSIDATARKAALISLPRDTYVSGGYSVPKLNSALGAGGGGKEGMEELMGQVTDLIGYRPDGYALIDLDSFVGIIDLLGGVDFDVPQDMHYDDPTQDLHIDLQAGPQHLDGKQSMGLVRFRSGYAQADLRRVEVQRDFLKAALAQHRNLSTVLKSPLLAGKFLSATTTDLSSGNMLWIARTLLACNRDSIEMQTLPGAPRMISGGSYYIVNAAAAAELLNDYANPYKTPITADMLKVRG